MKVHAELDMVGQLRSPVSYVFCMDGHTEGGTVNTDSNTAMFETIYQLPGMLKRSLQIGTLALGAGAAWGRVEAERHYPSDVLAGMAIGHFFGAFITDALLGLDYEDGAGATVEASRNGFKLAIFWNC